MAEFDSKAFLRTLTSQPGVYRMYDDDDALLYVGKARNLKRRVSSYFLRSSANPRIDAMVSQVARVEVTITHSEDEALLLEATLIKRETPRYNILYRDDKSYPYLRIGGRGDYPRIAFHRGSTKGPDHYYGPYPSAAAVRQTLGTLQRLFQLRPCTDSYFANRSRPCLQHQIQRCSAPCVGAIEPDDYAADVARARDLLEGRGDALASELNTRMESAAEALDFELAARVRDQLSALRRVQEGRVVSGRKQDMDLIAVAIASGTACVTVMSVRNGMNQGHRSVFPEHAGDATMAELLNAFLPQYYLRLLPPAEVLCCEVPSDADWISASLAQAHGRRVSISAPRRGLRRRLMELAQSTAEQALVSHRSASASQAERVKDLQSMLGIDQIDRMECFDISHTGGEGTVASCVVFDADGPVRTAYRRFNIEGVAAGDDYAAMAQAVRRRYQRVQDGEATAPDLVLIDGGPGQLAVAVEAIAEFGLEELVMIGVSKGTGRKPGLERLHRVGERVPIAPESNAPGLHLIQQIRDEAHRFAITGHRGRRDKARTQSGLEAVDGLGPARRRALLQQFGGVRQVRRASVEELARVPGVSRTLARRIHDHFHGASA